MSNLSLTEKIANWEVILGRFRQSMEQSAFVARICKKTGDEEGHKGAKKDAIMFALKAEAAEKEIEEAYKEAEGKGSEIKKEPLEEKADGK